MSAPESVSTAEAEAEATPTTPAAPGAPSDADPRWRRTHPASPWLDNVAFLAAAGYFMLRVAQSMVRDDVDLVAALRGSSGWFWLLVAVMACTVLAMVSRIVAWRHRWFLVADDAIHVRSGRLSRTVTTVPLDRVQSVDVVLPFVPRLFGFAKVTVEVAGDDGSAVTLALLRQRDAQHVRGQLLRVGTTPRERTEPAGPGARSPIHARARQAGDDGAVAVVPSERARRALLRSPGLWGAAAALLGSVGLIVGGIVVGEPVAALSAIVVVVGSAVGLAKAGFAVLERSSGFRVMADGEALRVHHGLAEKHERTITPRRVQGVTLSQPIWWRTPDWWAVTVIVPGVEDDDEAASSSSDLFPLATRDEALRLIALALPGVPPSDVIARTMTGQRLTGSGYLAAPRRARIFAPLGWRHEGALVTFHALVVRHGRWNRKVTVLRHEHPQVLRIRQGWWARRWRLADVTFELPGKNLTVDNLDLDDAQNLFREQVHRAS